MEKDKVVALEKLAIEAQANSGVRYSHDWHMAVEPEKVLALIAEVRRLTLKLESYHGSTTESLHDRAEKAEQALAARPSVPQQGQAQLVTQLVTALEAMLVMMDRGGQPRKLDEALTWRANDEHARKLATDALAASRSEEATPQDDERCKCGHYAHPCQHDDCSCTEFSRNGAPAAGSAERAAVLEAYRRCERIARECNRGHHGNACGHAVEIADKIRALAGTDTDVAKEKL